MIFLLPIIFKTPFFATIHAYMVAAISYEERDAIVGCHGGFQ